MKKFQKDLPLIVLIVIVAMMLIAIGIMLVKLNSTIKETKSTETTMVVMVERSVENTKPHQVAGDVDLLAGWSGLISVDFDGFKPYPNILNHAWEMAPLLNH